jgi:short-subunit dehydrogenase
MPNETAVVTGAGAGTGREFTKLLLADGAIVIAVSLLSEELDALTRELDPGQGRLVTKQADLSESNAAEDLLTWCDEQGYDVDVLINNAGFAIYGEPTEVDMSRVETMIALNVVTCLKMSVLFARRMKQRGSGKILVMGSTAGIAPTPRLGAYCATKAFTNSASWSLGAELRGTGVDVTVVTPGSFRSNFAGTANVRDTSLLGKVYRRERLDASGVARRAYSAMRKGRATVTVGRSGQLAKVLGRVLPPVFVARVMHAM